MRDFDIVMDMKNVHEARREKIEEIILDAFHGLGFDETNILSYTEDGVHLNEQARKIYGTFVGEKL